MEGERQKEGGWRADGYDRNNENKQDRMRGERWEEEDSRMSLYAEIQKSQVIVSWSCEEEENDWGWKTGWQRRGGKLRVRGVKEKMRVEREKVKRLKSTGPQPESADISTKHEIGDSPTWTLQIDSRGRKCVCLHQLLLNSALHSCRIPLSH